MAETLEIEKLRKELDVRDAELTLSKPEPEILQKKGIVRVERYSAKNIAELVPQHRSGGTALSSVDSVAG